MTGRTSAAYKQRLAAEIQASAFYPGDQVRARLWPELGTGAVLEVTPPTLKRSNAMRVAEVDWTEVGQVSRHSFSALALVDRPSHEVAKQEATATP